MEPSPLDTLKFRVGEGTLLQVLLVVHGRVVMMHHLPLAVILLSTMLSSSSLDPREEVRILSAPSSVIRFLREGEWAAEGEGETGRS